MPKFVQPVPINTTEEPSAVDGGVWQSFFTQLRDAVNNPRVTSLATDPGTANVPSGTASLWKNTTSGLVKLWTNDGGVMKSVTLT